MSEPSQELPIDAIAALHRGSKIDAIKCARVASGTGLKEAKDIVEHYIEMHPDIKSRMVAANMESAKISLRWLVIIAVVGAAAFYFMTG